MNESRAVNKKCPYAFCEPLGDFIFCVGNLCMSWSTVGYCKRLSGDAQEHVRYRPVVECGCTGKGHDD